MRGTEMRRIGTWRIWRVVAGFLIAPLVPALVLLLIQFAEQGVRLLMGTAPPVWYWQFGIFIAFYVTVICYATALPFGIPAYLILKRKRRVALGYAIFGGLLIGAIAYPIWVSILFPSGNGIIDRAPKLLPLILISGMVAATAFWLIARPDRAAVGR